MRILNQSLKYTISVLALLLALPALSFASCKDLPSHAELEQALKDSVFASNGSTSNGGLDIHMWATIVDRDGVVCAVTFSGNDRGDQWPGSRVISAQKANTANAFSLPNQGGNFPAAFSGLALSTANLWAATQPGGSLFGLQFSNPVDTSVAFGQTGPGTNAKNYGQRNDPLVGRQVGGVNVFGGGLALYDENEDLLGAVGVSGDTSCADHNIAWRVRDGLELDNVPVGVNDLGFGVIGTADNIIFDTTNAFGHPECGFGEVGANAIIVVDHPIGPNP